MNKKAAGLIRRINSLIVLAEDIYAGGAGASGYLPSIINSLKEMKKAVLFGDDSPSRKRKRAGGLFRIISDDVEFLNGKLGKKIVKLLNGYAKG